MMTYQNPYDNADSWVPPAKKERTDYIINKVIQALNILEQFHDEVDELSLAQLSLRIGVNEASVSLLLATLKSRNYLEQNPATQNYRLGVKNLELAQTVLRQTDLYRVSHPVLAAIAGECGETTAVAVLSKSHVIELDAVQSENPVQVRPRVGVHLPVHCTAAGKALIATMTDRARDALFKGVLMQYTPNTITCPEQLQLQVRRIAEVGFAVDDEEMDSDVRSVASVIHDYAGRVVGALVITGPSCRIGLDRLTGELTSLVQSGAREISAKLGYHHAGQQSSHDPGQGAETPMRRGTTSRAVARKCKPAGTSRAA